MNLVIDANSLFSILIKNGTSAKILINPFIKFYAPEFILEEFEKYKNEIFSKTKRTKEEFQEIIAIIKEIVNILPKKEFEEFIFQAEQISPDIKDAVYFALALKLNCSIWSNDKKLKEQNQINIYSTEELVQILKV